MALVVADPLDPLDLIQAALAARAGATPLPVTTAVDRLEAVDLRDLEPGDGVDDLSPLVHVHRIPPRAGRTATLARPLPPEVAERLGVAALWTHQAEAIDLAREGRSVVVATGTASGKSLCYQAPLAEAAAAPVRRGTSLLVFPTKALAHDQLRALTEREFAGVVAGAYDGDTGTEERTWIRRHATCVLTNPEMLHSGILPHHDRWAKFLSRLRYVVVDELHAFRGIFGSHVAHLLRRLRRLAHHYGADPTFVCCSATIGQPERLATALCGLPVEAVVHDGAPRGERLVAVWNPPPLDARHRATGVVERRDGRVGGRAGAVGPEDDRLLPESPVHGGGRGRRPPAAAVPLPAAGQALPGRLPGGGAAGDRGRAFRRTPRRGGRHQRAGAGHRRRRAGRRRAERLPGHDRVVLAAGGAGRAVRAGVRGGAGGRVRPARPVDGCAPRRAGAAGRPSRWW